MQWEDRHTLDLERVSPFASTQMYSAMIWPFWSSLRYLFNCIRCQIFARFWCVICDWLDVTGDGTSGISLQHASPSTG